jgi:hypothetical protein
MAWTRGLLGHIGLLRCCITGIIPKANLSSTRNESREIIAPAEVNLVTVVLRIDISVEEE